MTFELLSTIALLCQTAGSDSGFSRKWSERCQARLIQCIELDPTPIRLAKCVKEERGL